MRVLAALKAKLKDFERGRNQWVEPLRQWILDTKQADFLSSSSNFSEIASFVRKIGTNPSVRDKSMHFECPPEFEFAASRQAELGGAAASQPRDSALSDKEVSICGWGGIRTHEALRPGGFQNRSFQPLTHPSECVVPQSRAGAKRVSPALTHCRAVRRLLQPRASRGSAQA